MANSSDKQRLYAQILDFKPKKADLRRMEILEAVIDCLAGEGVFGLTAEAIGKRTGMRRSHVAYYFPNQDEMLDAAIRFVVATGQEVAVGYLAAAADGTPKDRLHAYVRATFGWFERYPKHSAIMTLLHHYGCVNGKYRKLNEQIRTAGEQRLASLYEAMLPTGAKRDRKKLAIAAAAGRAYLAGVLTSIFAAGRPASLDAPIAEAERVLTALAKL